MPLPKPKAGEKQDAFMSRCMSEAYGTGAPSDRTQEQAVAMCFSAWREAHGGKKPSGKSIEQVAAIIANWNQKFGKGKAAIDRLVQIARAAADAPIPDDDESEDDFMDRCLDEVQGDGDDISDDDAESICEDAWGQKSAGTRGIVHKQHVAAGKGPEFILSDATPDRFGDIVEVEGWQTENFKRNPVALFSHRADFPVGTWSNIRTHDKALRGDLILAPKGISDRIDEIRGLVEAGILRAVSVGFKPLERRAVDPHRNDPFAPSVYTKSELVEVSLVAIPANPNALAVAKSLHLSPEVQRLVFAEHGNKSTGGASAYARTRAEHGNKRKQVITAASGKTHPKTGVHPMLLSQRIDAAEKFKVELQDQLTAHLETIDDSNPDDAAQAVTEDLNQKIATAERNLNNLKQAEQRLAKSASNGSGGGGGTALVPARDFTPARSGNGARPYGFTPKKVDALTYLIRQGVVEAFAHVKKQPVEKVLVTLYGEDECTKAYVDYCQKAASAPAMTNVTGWAAELAQQVYGDFLQLLSPSTVMPSLANLGLALTFGQAGKIVIPARAATPSLAGSFVGEGAAIPVRQGAFTTIAIVPKKLGVITTYTREMNEHSIPAIEGILRDSVSLDTGTAIDTVLLDANPATSIRPAGLRNGVSGLTPTAGGGFNALVGDIKQLAGALLTATAGHIRNGVFLINPQQALSISLTQPPAAATALFPFADEVAANRLRSFKLIVSGNVPLGMVIALDAADFVTAGAESPRFEVSDQATLHMEDTAPTDITGGTPSPATPVKSMFQTDSLALRLVWPLNWTLRRTGMVSWLTGVTW
jgi:HK97 family phage prohead protease/HK97 family phage major capsid protein